MSFEERLLMELKTEVEVRARKRRKGRRLLAGAAVAAIAAAAVIAAPLLTGAAPPAYALAKNADGTLTLQINEFKDPGQVERDLKAVGVTADISYLEPGFRCREPRGEDADNMPDLLGKSREEMRRVMEAQRSYKAAHWGGDGVIITPGEISAGQTLILDFVVNDGRTPGPVWRYVGHLINGPVTPCEVERDPTWNDQGS